jgi:hypothetical protein
MGRNRKIRSPTKVAVMLIIVGVLLLISAAFIKGQLPV